MCQYFSLLTFSGSDRYSLPTDTSPQMHTHWKEGEKQGGREGGDEGRKECRKGEMKRGKERKRDRLCKFYFGLGNFPSAILGHLAPTMPSSPLPVPLPIFLHTFFEPKHRLIHK